MAIKAKAEESIENGPVAAGRWKVLVVDYDETCLLLLEKMMQSCGFEVTKCRYAKEALSVLEDRRNRFDVVVSELQLPDMDGYELLRRIGFDMDLPIIMMSTMDDEDTIRNGIVNGACDFLVKPVRIESIRYLWKYAYLTQRKKNGSKGVANESRSCNNFERGSRGGDAEHAFASDVECGKCITRSNGRELGELLNHGDSVPPRRKKQRVIWTPDLHEKFVAAVNQFGISKAVPMKILDTINVPGLTRENVASHLQKYRQYHRRLEASIHHQSGQSAPLKGHREPKVDRHNFLAERKPTVQGSSTAADEAGEYGALRTKSSISSMSEFELSQLAVNYRNLGISDHHQIARTAHEALVVPLPHQLIFERSLTEEVSKFLSLPASSSIGTISLVDANGAYCDGLESKVRIHRSDDIPGNDASAASVFPSFKETAEDDVIEGGIYDQNGNGIRMENTAIDNLYNPASVAYPLIDSRLLVTPCNGLHVRSKHGSFPDMEMASVGGGQWEYSSLGSIDHGIPNDALLRVYDWTCDPLIHLESLDQNELIFEQGLGLVQQEFNSGGFFINDAP
ncbi:hypothetical protein Nepgr_014349 [Nepenthes gracilis]|uniref:Uncharacterized protein n=1 Tax=Nepenthes gracilis TaxID=150966 RepID=A0AAD3XPS2_NEPGR|nr:hypothetical protein Nepgr_014349 [Nepenthes gracilis]